MTNFGEYDSVALENNYKNACKDKKFKELVDTINLDSKQLMKYTSKLKVATEESINCSTCKNLHECKNKLTGFRYTPKIQGDHLRFDNIACNYMQDKLKREETSCTYYKLPELLKNISMKDIDISDAKRVPIIKWLKNFYDKYQINCHQKGLYLNGSFGSGKTFLICAMLNELAKKGANIIIVYYPELLRSLKESFYLKEQFNEVDFSSRISKLKESDILFLDDIGAESVTPWARDEILGTILQYRMDANLPTFFTSNLSIDELEAHLSETKNSVDKVKARRIIERIKQLTDSLELISKNRRN